MSVFPDIPIKRKSRLEPIRSSLSTCRTLRSIPDFENIPNIIPPDKSNLNYKESVNLISQETITSLKDENLENSNVSMKNCPKEVILTQNGLVFLDLLTMKPINLLDTQCELGFFSDLAQKKATKVQYLIIIPIRETLEISDFQITLNSLYENLKAFQEMDIPVFSSFSILLLFNGLNTISSDVSALFFENSEKKEEIPFAYSMEARKINFCNDKVRKSLSVSQKLPLDSAYVYEMEYKPTSSFDDDFKMRLILCVKLQEINDYELFRWSTLGFGNLINPTYLGFFSIGSRFASSNDLVKTFGSFIKEESVAGILLRQTPEYDPKNSYSNFSKYMFFRASLQQIYGNWLEFEEENHFGVFRWNYLNESLQDEINLIKMFEENYKGNIDFNSLLALELKKKFVVQQKGIGIIHKPIEEMYLNIKKTRDFFLYTSFILINTFGFQIKRIYFSQEIGKIQKTWLLFVLIQKFLGNYFLKIFSPGLLFIAIFIGTQGEISLNDQNFELMNFQTITLSLLLLLIFSIWHFAWFFRPEENFQSLKKINLIFTIIFYGWVCIFLYDTYKILEIPWILFIFLLYFLIPVILSPKKIVKLIKFSPFFFYYWPSKIFVHIYCLAGCREERDLKEQSLNFEKILFGNAVLGLLGFLFISHSQSNIYYMFLVLAGYCCLKIITGFFYHFSCRKITKSKSRRVHVLT